MSSALVIILVGTCVALSSAMVGTFLVLRKMALLGDAISHAVLPGIVIAFMFTHSRASLPMVIGAGVFGVLTVFLVGMLKDTKRLGEDAAIGVVFPALFSIGVILISKFAAQVDLDLDCVLYGEIAYAPLDILYWGDQPIGPRALWTTGATLCLVAGFIAIFYKELKITSFDPELAESLGFSPRLMHYLLMAAVSITVVASFESVGAILVVAMLIVPAATAFLLSTRLSVMIGLSAMIGITSAVAGYYLASALDSSIAGGMASVAGILFLGVLCLSPQGLLARVLLQHRLASRLSGQLLLLHLEDESEQTRETIMSRFGWDEPQFKRVVASLLARGDIEVKDAKYSLTTRGTEELTTVGTSGLVVHKP